ncbi:hypothetical protein D187_000200 [Cystobacter fuscus DSM 2262]|uniref:Uncharacterized protein n=1 Tax=Cystobacter fuscus (strain ATCC 25194 / DSM 2262 / NBRC 100088 / M29) TaxID=1242864 RepID=S9R6X5_CYSF2|nr:hypothetical protein [Cystobacter fuscus]EPX64778.1 hypothetical protein D187_000200 [Cystobacter fuscus DSM 2262]
MTLRVVADAFGSDKLYLDFQCGLTATVQNSNAFTLDERECPSYENEGCAYVWRFSDGKGTVTEGDPALELRFNGSVNSRCSDGSSLSLNFLFTLTAMPAEPSSIEQRVGGRDSSLQLSVLPLLRAELEQAARAAPR